MKIKKNLFSQFSIISQLILLTFLSLSAFGAAGDIDTSFNSYLVRAPQGSISNSLVQPDGKIIITGQFNVVNGVARTNIARLNPDGSLDTSFTPPETMPGDSGIAGVHTMFLQPDGKIIIAGEFFWIGNQSRKKIARLNANGTPDIAFNSNPWLDTVASAGQFALSPDGKIYTSATRLIGGFYHSTLIRMNLDGSIDAETDPFIGYFRLQPDGKIINYSVGTNADPFLQRLNTDFSVDNTFAQSEVFGSISDILIQPDGKTVIGGSFTQVNGSPLNRVARFNTDGSVDTTFNINAVGPNGTVSKIRLLPNGKILINGTFSSVNNVPKGGLALLNSDGTLDNSFTAGITTPFFVRDLDVQADGKIIVSATLSPESGVNYGQVIRLNSDGSVDPSLQPVIFGDFGTAQRTLVLPDNKILVSGNFTYTNSSNYKYFVKLNADGTPDTSFHQNTFSYGGEVFDVFADGKILVSGTNSSLQPTYRLNADGTPDISYINVPTVHDIKTLPDGRALISAYGMLLRYNTDGTRDDTFIIPVRIQQNPGVIYKILLQPDGKILVSGDFTTLNKTARGGIARLNADGTIDSSFNPPGGANAAIFDMALRADGKIYVGGSFTGINFTNRKYSALLNPDGSLDTSFNPVIDKPVYALRLQSDGRLLIGGIFDIVNGAPRHKYARLNADGTLDTSFNAGYGANNAVRDIDLQSNGRIIIAGDFSYLNNINKPGIARLLNNITPALFDFDGDGKTDISIFRPGVGEWWYSRSSDGGNYAAQFGNSTDKLVPGDYTGDGRADIAIFRPSSGEWFILRSEDGSYYSFPFGTSGDIPTVGDFDGDGKADQAVFRPSDTNWYIRRSSDSGFTIQQFGANGDAPVVADYDGDGKSDIAIWRASAGEWWIQKSSNSSVVAFQFGNSSDKPVQGDYTGDGKADVAIWRPSTGEWFILRSNDFSYYSFPFGTNGDIPAPGDYDGDGRFDATVFRPSDSTWYVQRSTAGTLIQSFGITGDLPVPNVFVP